MPNRIAECARCHEEKTIISRGLCSKCRYEEEKAGTLDQNYPAKPRGRQQGDKPRGSKDYRKRGICTSCGNERLIAARGMCSSCYQKERNKEKVEKPLVPYERPSEPTPDQGICPACGLYRTINLDSGFCVKCHDRKLGESMMRTEPPRENNLEELEPEPKKASTILRASIPSAEKIYRYIRGLELRNEYLEKNFRAMRRKIMSSVNEAMEKRILEEEDVEKELQTDIEDQIAKERQTIVCRDRNGSGEKIYKVPEEALNMENGSPRP